MAVAESQGIESDLLPQIATGFCSGMARTGGFCGALSGAMMSLGLLNGRSQPGASVDENYKAVQALIAQFNDKFGSTNCQELTGCHLGTPEGQAKFRASGQGAKCVNYAGEAAAMAIALGKPNSVDEDF